MLNIPNQERETFEHNLLTEAHLEVRFSPQIESSWGDISSLLKEELEELGFPDFVHEQSTFIRFENNTEGSPLQNIQIQHAQEGVQTKKKEIQVVLRKDRILLSSLNYKSFEEFWELAVPVLEVVSAKLEVGFNWLGLRKKNFIVAQLDNDQYMGDGVNKEFFAPLFQQSFSPSAVQQSQSFYQLREGDITSKIKVTAVRGNTPNNMQIQMDFDFNQNFQKTQTIEQLTETAQNLNQQHFNLFHWSCAPDLLKYMKGE